MKTKIVSLALAFVLANVVCALGAEPGEGKKPNILMIMGDDIGWYNPSCYNHGDMGYRTPNIDQIAKEGAMFTCWYAQQSCTAGRAAFITGQSPIRTGLTKVGLPGADVGLSAEDPTVAEFLKNLGYATAQFGKNHLGDLNKFLPTVHGFDEFFGNLYHLNAEEEPENPDYPKNPAFRKKFGPRGVLHCWATDTEDATVDPQFGKVGKQRIENTGALTVKRMETIDDEFTEAALGWMEKQAKAGKPFFCYYNSTRMHIFTHLKKESQGKTGLGVYPDGMVEHDARVGQLLTKLDELGVADNTIVIYTTDNGAEVMSWPDGGATPFRGEKATGFEGAFRVPMCIRWPGVIKPGTVYNDIFAHEDLIPTFAAAAGEPDLVEKVKKGYEVAGKTYKVHLDGYNLIPLLKGEVKASPRKEFLYWSDDGDLLAIRYEQWKVAFKEQEHTGLDVWKRDFTNLRAPNIYNIRSDPFERGPESFEYGKWVADRTFLLVPAQTMVSKWLSSMKEFPIRQKPASFNLDDVMTKLQTAPGEKPLEPTGSATGKPGEQEKSQPPEPEAKPQGSASNPLGDAEWRLTELNGERIERPEGARPQALKFDAVKRAVTGSTGVNRLIGGYQLDADKLKFGQLATTRMAGTPELMKQETEFVDALKSADSWKRTGDRLELLSGDKVIAVFARATE